MNPVEKPDMGLFAKTLTQLLREFN